LQNRSATTGLVDLGTLGGSNNNSWAYGINSAGQVTGTSAATDSYSHSFIWTITSGFQELGLRRDSTGYAIDDLGRVVGTAAFGSATLGFAWTKTRGNQLLSGVSYLTAIDNRGAATGWVTVAGPYVTHAILWSQSSGVTDLGTLTNTSGDSPRASESV
jgi:probable HAF family extracellular repeat protein